MGLWLLLFFNNEFFPNSGHQWPFSVGPILSALYTLSQLIHTTTVGSALILWLRNGVREGKQFVPDLITSKWRVGDSTSTLLNFKLLTITGLQNCFLRMMNVNRGPGRWNSKKIIPESQGIGDDAFSRQFLGFFFFLLILEISQQQVYDDHN